MIHVEAREDVRVLTLERGGANALDADFLRAIADAFAAADRDGVRGVVLTAGGKIFCAGLDLLAHADGDRARISSLLEALNAALRAIFVCGRPTVAALQGHAIAGGALLALACDRRIAAEGAVMFGLTEVKLGVSIPGAALELARHALARRALETLVYGGAVHDTARAHALGAIDEIVPDTDLLDRAIACVHEWTPSPSAFADIKARLHAPTLAAMDAARADDASFVDLWFAEPARTRIAAAVAQLRSRGR